VNGYNFTDRVRTVLQAAREEAAALNHEYLGPEHILLGLLRTDDGVPIATLNALDVPLEDLRESTLELLKPGTPGKHVGPDLPYTSRAKKVLEEALTEARDLRHSYLGTEHILLGLLREQKNIAAQALVGHGVTLEAARAEILRTMEAEATPERSEPPRARRPQDSSVPSSFLIVVEDPNGQLGTRRFTTAEEAIDFLNRWRGAQ